MIGSRGWGKWRVSECYSVFCLFFCTLYHSALVYKPKTQLWSVICPDSAVQLCDTVGFAMTEHQKVSVCVSHTGSVSDKV